MGHWYKVSIAVDAHKWNYLFFSYTPGVDILSYCSNSHTDSLKCAIRVTGVGGPSRRCSNCLPARQDSKSEAIPELMAPLKSWRMMDGCSLLYSHSIHQTGLENGEEIGIMKMTIGFLSLHHRESEVSLFSPLSSSQLPPRVVGPCSSFQCASSQQKSYFCYLECGVIRVKKIIALWRA